MCEIETLIKHGDCLDILQEHPNDFLAVLKFSFDAMPAPQ